MHTSDTSTHDDAQARGSTISTAMECFVWGYLILKAGAALGWAIIVFRM